MEGPALAKAFWLGDLTDGARQLRNVATGGRRFLRPPYEQHPSVCPFVCQPSRTGSKSTYLRINGITLTYDQTTLTTPQTNRAEQGACDF
jgi:hypothetical protein